MTQEISVPASQGGIPSPAELLSALIELRSAPVAPNTAADAPRLFAAWRQADNVIAKATASEASTEGFDPSRLMALYCAVANARFALEYWEREARVCAANDRWTLGPLQRGRHEIQTLQEWDGFLRSLACAPAIEAADTQPPGTPSH